MSKPKAYRKDGRVRNLTRLSRLGEDVFDFSFRRLTFGKGFFHELLPGHILSEDHRLCNIHDEQSDAFLSVETTVSFP